jgi:hypothetical protein
MSPKPSVELFKVSVTMRNVSSEITPPDQNKAWSADIASDETVFSRTVDHAKTAYTNAQDVIKFVDLKSNVLIALSTVVSGFALALAKWNFELPSTSAARISVLAKGHPCLTWTALILFGLSLVATIISYAAATWSMIVRPAKRGAFTVLFPVPRENKRETHRRLIAERLSGMSREGVLHEFSEQLFAVGQILQAKQRNSRIGAITVLAQLALLTVAVFLYLCLVASS